MAGEIGTYRADGLEMMYSLASRDQSRRSATSTNDGDDLGNYQCAHPSVITHTFTITVMYQS